MGAWILVSNHGILTHSWKSIAGMIVKLVILLLCAVFSLTYLLFYTLGIVEALNTLNKSVDL